MTSLCKYFNSHVHLVINVRRFGNTVYNCKTLADKLSLKAQNATNARIVSDNI